jgi:hypothetical protein
MGFAGDTAVILRAERGFGAGHAALPRKKREPTGTERLPGRSERERDKKGRVFSARNATFL